MTEIQYPGIVDRVKGAVGDMVVILIMMTLISQLFSNFENVPDGVRIGAFIFVFFLYDPIFTSSFGGTLGHMMAGIRVKRDSDHSKNIYFPQALFRFAVKALLGWLSLLTISRSKERRAVHDMMVSSVVIYKE